MDRAAQINWIRELAENLSQNMGYQWGPTAKEVVDYALSDEGRESWGIEIPEWFDDYDRELLVRRVEYLIG